MTEKPRPGQPDSARSPGQQLRQAITDAFILNPAEKLILSQAAEIADALAKINRQLADKKVLTQKGAKGVSVVSPLLLAQRRHSEVLARLLGDLALPDEDEESGESRTTRNARRAARARWDREGA